MFRKEVLEWYIGFDLKKFFMILIYFVVVELYLVFDWGIFIWLFLLWDFLLRVLIVFLFVEGVNGFYDRKGLVVVWIKLLLLRKGLECLEVVGKIFGFF